MLGIQRTILLTCTNLVYVFALVHNVADRADNFGGNHTLFIAVFRRFIIFFSFWHGDCVIAFYGNSE